MEQDTFTSFAELSLCKARSENKDNNQNSSEGEENQRKNMDLVVTEKETNNHKPVTRITLPKNKVNILEFIGIGNGFDLSQPLEPALQLSRNQQKDFDQQEAKSDDSRNEDRSKETLGESDSGLDDDKGNELSDDVLFTESDSDDVISSDGEYSGCEGISGYVCEVDTNSYDIAAPSDSEDEERPKSPEFAPPVILLEVNRDVSLSETYDEPTFDEVSDDSEDEESCSRSYEINAEGDNCSDGSDCEQSSEESCCEENIEKIAVKNQISESLECQETRISSSLEQEVKTDVSTEFLIEIDRAQNQENESVAQKDTMKEPELLEGGQEEIVEFAATTAECLTETNACSEEGSKISQNEASDLVEVPEIVISPAVEENPATEDDLDESQSTPITEETEPGTAETVDEEKQDEMKSETLESVKDVSEGDVAIAQNDEEPKELVGPQSPSNKNVVYESNKEVIQTRDVKEDITLRDYDMSIKDIETERRRIIGNQAVRRKTIQNWINGQEPETDEEAADCPKPEPVHVQIVGEKCKAPVQITEEFESKNCEIQDIFVEKSVEINVCSQPSNVCSQPSSVFIDDGAISQESDPVKDDNVVKEDDEETVQTEEINNSGEVVTESIIERKSSTKTYWENLMMSTSGATDVEPEPAQNMDETSPEPVCEENEELSDSEACEFPEFDMEEPRVVPEVKEPPRKVPVVIHKKPKSGPITPICIEVMSKPNMSGNIVEQEIQMQQMREEEFRRETSLRSPVNGKMSPLPSHKPQVVGEVYRSNSSNSSCTSPIPQTNEFTAEIVLAPPTHYRDSSDSGTFDSESFAPSNLLGRTKGNFGCIQQDIDQGFISPDDDKRSFDPEISSDLGDELQCTSPSINHTGSYESLNSVGTSGGSSVDYSPRKNSRVITVKPLASDDDLENSTNGGFNYLNETPVEREIRQAKEREEELRREQRNRPSSVSSSDSERCLKNSSYQRNGTTILKNNINRSNVKSVATSRIQQEIEEQTNRELELRSSGNIRTTSQDHVDSKLPNVFQKTCQIQVKPITKASVKANGRVSNNGTVSNGYTQSNGHYTNGHALNSHPKVNGSSLSVGTVVQQPVTKRNSLPVMNKGGLSMHKFISSGGKLGGFKGPFGGKMPNKTEMKPTVIYEPAAIIRKPSSDQSSEQKPVYRKYCTAESKIQTELRQMKEREEELKRQRTRLHGLSQPNLTLIEKIDDSKEQQESKKSDLESERSPSPTPFRPLKERCMSNPNLLDDGDEKDSAMSKTKATNPRRRSILIEQWENKIHVQSK